MKKKMAVFWVVASCRLMEAVHTSETLVNSYQSTRRYNQEDSHLHSHRRENLKSYQYMKKFFSLNVWTQTEIELNRGISEHDTVVW
jgi:hypothetical protein